MKNIFGLMILIFGLSSHAADISLEVGFRQQSGDGLTGTTSKSEVGYQFGGIAALPITQVLYFRTGMLYTQRPLTVTSSGSDSKYNMTYFDVPATLLYKIEEFGGIYAGVLASMNLDHNCTGTVACTVDKAKSMINPFIMGASFKFAPQMGIDLYFENAGDLANNLLAYRSAGLNFSFSFE